jgi:hypothetical protein
MDILLWVTVVAGIIFTLGWPLAGFTEREGFDLTVPVSIGEESLLPVYSLTPTPRTGGSDLGSRPSGPGLPEEAPELALVDATGELRFSSPKLLPSLAYWCHGVVGFGLLICGLLLLRRILATTVEGHPFHKENARRLNRLGWIIVLGAAIASVSQFFFGAWAINQVEPTRVPIIASLDIKAEWIACGLLVLLLAAIWKEAVRIAEDQALTV